MRRRLVFTIGIIIVVVLGVWIIFSLRGKNLFLSRQEFKKGAATWSEVLSQAAAQEAKGNLLEAKCLYEELVNDFPNFPQVVDWQKRVGDLNIRLLFSSAITPGSRLYEIKSGDSLAKIAKKFNTTVELLKRSNGLLSNKIITGRKLKVRIGSFNIVVDKSQNILILKTDEEVIKNYVVSTGINNSTPTGTFKIINKLVSPTWFKTGAVVPPESPDNILGSRWMGLNLANYGIHGTTDNGTLGQQITRGCIRMSNSDVEELFTIMPVGAEVIIVD